jgi:hypothetical protein
MGVVDLGRQSQRSSPPPTSPTKAYKEGEEPRGK